MYRLSRRFNVPVDELAEANCIVDTANITAGQILYVPPGSDVTPPPPGTPAPGSTAAPGEVSAPGGVLSFNCDNPTATIVQPAPGTVLSGAFAIYGTATHESFQFYRLQISGGGTDSGEFATIDVYRNEVINGQLGTLNAAAFTPGDYWLRLTIVDQSGNYPPECTIRVRFE
jgi:hypothetical protein